MAIGTVFDRNGPPWRLEEKDWAQTGDQFNDYHSFGTRFWGAYWWIKVVEGELRLVREPSGASPCYWVFSEGVLIAASDPRLALELGGLAISIDWSEVGIHVWSAGLPHTQTAVGRLKELLPGEELCVAERQLHITSAWDPWDYVDEAEWREPEALSERLRRTIENSVSALASRHKKVILGVSGGLDSSIVAACLARSRTECIAATIFTQDADGDERQYARAVCDALGMSLIELEYDVKDLNLELSTVPHIPRPIGRLIGGAYDTAFVRLAEQHGVDGFFSGNGGDNVFAFAQSAAPLCDRIQTDGLSLGIANTLFDISRLTGASIGRVGATAARIWRKRKRDRPWHFDPRLLREDFLRDTAIEPLAHPWLRAQALPLPGKASHVAGLLVVQQALAGTSRTRFAPIVNPLMSQPVIELCLGIPTWLWCLNGRNRSIARQAFDGRLPKEIVSRQSKGGPDSFAADVVRHYRSNIREILLDGDLVRHGIADPRAIEEALVDREPNSGVEQLRLLSLVDAEAWIRSWQDGDQSPARI